MKNCKHGGRMHAWLIEDAQCYMDAASLTLAWKLTTGLMTFKPASKTATESRFTSKFGGSVSGMGHKRDERLESTE